MQRTQIVRGDGKSRIYRQSCMDAANFPTAQATVVLMNPPFLGKSKPSSKSTQEFYDRAKEGQDGTALG